jgi:UDP-glucose/galactose:(glucosyl)LPS alpha-1,2-glucosyl/galactosyltransferase
MNNFLYCLDSNYNIPASCSIYSLLEKSKEKVNIFIMHKDATNKDFLPRKIIKHTNLNKLIIYKVDLTDYDFPNIFGTHVSEATYYRLFIQDYIKEDIDYITYLDCDAFCINDPIVLINENIEKMKSSGFTISSMLEPGLEHHSNNTLKLKSNKYFNAGVMIIDLNKWKTDDLKNNSLRIIKEHKEKLLFWDQDVLNLYFDGQYEPIPRALNFKVDMDTNNKAINIENDLKHKISILHYSGKFKPWSVRGAVNHNAEFFQEIYRSIYTKKYYLNINYKQNAINDIVTSVFTGTLFSAKYPLFLIWFTLKSLIRK